jgi:hypothetical protein
MKQTPLFSTYSQGENRVTGSLLAVFERIGLSLVERLLGAASGESELRMVRFQNQVSEDRSVPDAGISARFKYLFEVKAQPGSVNEPQLRNHLSGVVHGENERLFVVTPDLDEPEQVESIRNEGEPVSWFSFAALAAAIRDELASSDSSALEHERILLWELVRLFDDSGLLTNPPDAAIVAGSDAYDFYKKYGLYVRQITRCFHDRVEQLGFYTHMRIERELPFIKWRRNHVEVSKEGATSLAVSGDPEASAVGNALLAAIDDGEFKEDAELEVFLLSGPADQPTRILDHVIEHRERGSWMPFGGWKYARSEILNANPETTTDLDEANNSE